MLHGVEGSSCTDMYALNKILQSCFYYLFLLRLSILLIALRALFAIERGDLKWGPSMALWMIYAIIYAGKTSEMQRTLPLHVCVKKYCTMVLGGFISL